MKEKLLSREGTIIIQKLYLVPLFSVTYSSHILILSYLPKNMIFARIRIYLFYLKKKIGVPIFLRRKSS